MNNRPPPITIREFRSGDEPTLREVFFTSIHNLAAGEYNLDQLTAWAPESYDCGLWAERMRVLHPFVAEWEGRVAGYADLQESGYIDHFYVHGACARRGVGAALMARLHRVAGERRTKELFSDVSLTAEAFFQRHGFAVERRNVVTLRGIALNNARMRKQILSGAAV